MDNKTVVHIYTLGYYSDVKTKKKKEIIKFSSKWVGLEKIMLTEVTETQENKHYIFYLICGSQAQIFRHACVT